jgi:hypothetical protein
LLSVLLTLKESVADGVLLVPASIEKWPLVCQGTMDRNCEDLRERLFLGCGQRIVTLESGGCKTEAKLNSQKKDLAAAVLYSQGLRMTQSPTHCACILLQTTRFLL